MAHNNRNWESLGRNIQNVVDQAVNSRDYQQLNQTVRQVVEQVVDTGSEAVQKILDSAAHRSGKKLYGRTVGKIAKAVLQYLSGSTLAMFAFAVLLGGTITEDPIWNYPGLVVFFLILLAIGIWLISSVIKTAQMIRRFKVYGKRSESQAPSDS